MSGVARHTRSVHLHRMTLDAIVFRCRTFPQEAGEKELQRRTAKIKKSAQETCKIGFLIQKV